MTDEAQLEGLVTDSAQLDTFALSNLHPPETGLLMTVWLAICADAPHDVVVRVSQSHGRRTLPDALAILAVRPAPRLIHGRLSARDLQRTCAWIALNSEVIVDHWEGREDTFGLVRRLRPLPA